MEQQTLSTYSPDGYNNWTYKKYEIITCALMTSLRSPVPSAGSVYSYTPTQKYQKKDAVINLVKMKSMQTKHRSSWYGLVE